FLLYALVRFVGLREAWEDLRPRVAQSAQALGRLRVALALRRLVAPLIVVLALLLPAPVTGIELAITIDDLPTHGPLPPGSTRVAVADQIIEVLRRRGIRDAVGFVNGGQIAEAPELGIILERWIAAGYRLGNHTFGHLDADRAGPQAFLADVERNEPVIARYSGAEPDRLFRYPYLHEGATLIERDTVRQALRERRYQIAPVTVDFHDWAWNEMYVRCAGIPGAVDTLTRSFKETALRTLDWSETTANTLVQRPIKQILLLHVSALVALTLDDLLSAYEAKGVRFIPVREALEDPVYGIDPKVTWRDQENF